MDEEKQCIICKSPHESISYMDHENIRIVHCPRCGKIEYDEMFFYELETINEGNYSALISYWLHSHYRGVPIKLTKELIETILYETTLPSPNEQADNLLFYIGQNAVCPSESVDCKLLPLVSIIGTVTIEDVKYHLTYLRDEGLIYVGSHTTSDPLTEKEFTVFSANLTHKGWIKYYALLNESKDSRYVFMAMKFGKEETDNLYKNILVDAVRDTGFELRKLDDNPQAGLIDDRLRVEIRRSKFLISDLTHDNPGAYFEAGFAEGLGKKVIYICEKTVFDERGTHFDTNHHLTLKWDFSKPEEFAEQLKATIRNTFPNDTIMVE